MSRPGVWHTVWMNFKKSLAAREMKKYVGEDVHGNRYYQILGKRKSVMRFVISSNVAKLIELQRFFFYCHCSL